MTDEQDHMAVRALDFVRPAGEGYQPLLPAKDWINPPTQDLGIGKGYWSNAYAAAQAEAMASMRSPAPIITGITFQTANAPVPGEIYCLADLPFGEREPSQELKDNMGRALYAHARAVELSGPFVQRAGMQYKITTDVMQYYIIRRYGDEVKI